MRTDLRRWWIINRLHHHSVKKNDRDRWVGELEFYLWISGFDVFDPNVNMAALPDTWHTPVKKLHFIVITRLLFKTFDFADISRAINECADSEIGWVDKRVRAGSYGIEELRVSNKGEGHYSFSNFFVAFCKKYKLIGVIIWLIFLFSFWPFLKPFVLPVFCKYIKVIEYCNV